MKTKRVFAIICAAIMLVTVLAACGKAEPAADDKTETKEQTALFSTPRERLSQEPQNSPEWVTKLDAAKNAKQLFVVAGYERSTAWISMHEKDADGSWKMIMSTPGFIGKEGLGKTKEGDGMTPVGTFHFNKAFGIADDPGCAMDYTKADDNTYWSGDSDLMYNQMVSIKDYPDLKKDDSEHIFDYQYEYQYCLNISYNEDGTPGKGSAIFLHCFGDRKPRTGGCVAIPEEQMYFVMRHVNPGCVVVIDSMENFGAEF
ncbi:MAG: L,D-transpeptidase family protein [Ruminococcus sp.]